MPVKYPAKKTKLDTQTLSMKSYTDVFSLKDAGGIYLYSVQEL